MIGLAVAVDGRRGRGTPDARPRPRPPALEGLAGSMTAGSATAKGLGGERADARPGRDAQRKATKEHQRHHGKQRKHRSRRKPHKPVARRLVAVPHGAVVSAPLVAPATPPSPSSTPVPSVGSPPITAGQARRLLWRAGFGPTPGLAEALAGQPLEAVVLGMTRPAGTATLIGP